MKTPIHPVRHGTLPYSIAHTPILPVCVWRMFHTNRGNSPGGTGARGAGPSGAGLRARSDTPEGCGAGAPQPAGTAGGAGRLDACEPPLLRTDGYPLRPASPPGPGPGPVLPVCGHHANGGSHAILLVVIAAFRQQVDCQTSRSVPGPAEQLAGYIGSCCRGSRRSQSSTKPIPRWDVHFGVLKTTGRTPRILISPFGPNRAATDSAVWRYVHPTLALV